MPQKTHYQDDLFVLSVLAKALDASLSAEADSPFFKEKILGDILFVDGKLKEFDTLLTQNGHLIERAEYLKLLERTARFFLSVVRRLAEGDYPSAPAYGEDAESLRAVIVNETAMLAELADLLPSASAEGSASELVSSDELSELLRI